MKALFLLLAVFALPAHANVAPMKMNVTLERYLCKGIDCVLAPDNGRTTTLEFEFNDFDLATENAKFTIDGKEFTVTVQAYETTRDGKLIGHVSIVAHRSDADIFGFIANSVDLSGGLGSFLSLAGRSVPVDLTRNSFELFSVRAERLP